RVADLNSVRVETATPGTKVVIADVQATLKYEKVLDGDRAGESGHDGDGDDDAEKTTILDDDDDETKQRKRQYARTLAENRTTRDCVSKFRAELPALEADFATAEARLQVAKRRLELTKALAATYAASGSPISTDAGAGVGASARVADFLGGFAAEHAKAHLVAVSECTVHEKKVDDIRTKLDEARAFVEMNGYLVDANKDKSKDSENEYRNIASVTVTVEGPDADTLRHGGGTATASGDDDTTETVSLLVTYTVTNASWAPQYDLRVYSAALKAQLTYGATITQSTGEDWLKAQLLLSTAAAGSLATAVPKFTSRWTLDERIGSRWLSARQGLLSARPWPPLPRWPPAKVLSAPTFSAAPRPLPAQSTTVEQGLTAATYRIATLTNIPADDVGHRVGVAIVDLPVALSRVAVPRLAPGEVFLQGTITNESVYVLVPGEVRVSVDGSFVGKSRTDLVLPGSDFVMSLGVDPTLTATLKPLESVTDTGVKSKSAGLSLFGGGSASSSVVPVGATAVTHTQRIVIANKKAAAAAAGSGAAASAVPTGDASSIRVTVSDQIPIAQEAEIVVTVLEPDEKRGGVRVVESREAAARTGIPDPVPIGGTPNRSNASITKMGDTLRRGKSGSKSNIPSAASVVADGPAPILYRDIGVVEWDVSVPASASTEVVLKYQVLIPKDVKVTGLERK
ncbi:hypothetical protein BC828DRAFT_379279, partial [Blastocladiella britannica]